MMNIDDAYLTNVLLASTIALLAAATIAILRFQRLLRQWERQLGAAPAGLPKPETEAAEPVEERINALQKIAEQLARKEEMLQQKGRGDVPLEHAVRMAKSGADVAELTRSCGLKKGEAELLLKLHANREPVAGARPH
jgi:hypothetical protein